MLLMWHYRSYLKSLFGLKRAKTTESGSPVILVVPLVSLSTPFDYARTRLANDAKSAKGGGARRSRHLEPHLHQHTFPHLLSMTSFRWLPLSHI
jgi:hypothetical protein